MLLASFFQDSRRRSCRWLTPDGDADEALSSAAEENVNEIPQNLSSGNGHSQLPCPPPSLAEPRTEPAVVR